MLVLQALFFYLKKKDCMNIKFKICENYSHEFVGEKIDEFNSIYQNIKVYDLNILGKTLVLDDYIMVADYDENIYHELMVHPACLLLNEYNRALIIGGGDLLCAKRLLQYPFKIIDQFEIDIEVTNMMLKHFNHHQSFQTFTHHRFNPQYQDALQAIPKIQYEYDFISLDLNDPAQEEMKSNPLFTLDFYRNCYKKLSPNGLMTVQIGCPETFKEHFEKQVENLNKIFNYHLIYGQYMRCYGTYQFFYLGSKKEIHYHEKYVKDKLSLYKISKFNYHDIQEIIIKSKKYA